MIQFEKKSVITRRDALRMGGATGALVLCRQLSGAESLGGTLQERTAADLDHIMWGARDLDQGIAFIEAKTGVKAAFGGVHPNRGTRNALISLGERQYLEILAPDPGQPDVQDDRVALLKSLAEPRILTWAAGTRDIETVERNVLAAGLQSSGVAPGSRAKPDGSVLKWRTLAVGGHDGDVVPFLIEWDPDTVHPAADSPRGCKLRDLRLEHPYPERMNAFLTAMGLRVRVTRGGRAKITALLETPKGDYELT